MIYLLGYLLVASLPAVLSRLANRTPPTSYPLQVARVSPGCLEGALFASLGHHHPEDFSGALFEFLVGHGYSHANAAIATITLEVLHIKDGRPPVPFTIAKESSDFATHPGNSDLFDFATI